MDAPDELRRVLADAMAAADANQEFTYPELADAVLAVPGIADALARDAKVAEIVRATTAAIRNPQPGDPPGAYIYAEGMDDVFALYPEAGK